jgi:hypothetical protein
MRWQRTWRADPRAAALADRHYSRQRPGTAQFAPPGRFCGLITPAGDAVWVSVFPDSRFTEPRYRDAWLCTLFRNESDGLSSELIGEALAATRHAWSDPPPGGTITFVDPRRVRPKRDPGYCFLRAGFEREPEPTKDRGLVVLRLSTARHPAPTAAAFTQLDLVEAIS